MKATTEVNAIFNCSLSAAFKTPILGDARNIHSGFGMMPLVTHFTEDEHWGKENGSRKVFVAKNLFFKQGEWATDITLKRIENKYWQWELVDFKQNRYGISKFQAEWFTEEIEPGKVKIKYTYALYPTTFLFQPFLWIFTKTIWKMYMKHAMENIKAMAERGDKLDYE